VAAGGYLGQKVSKPSSESSEVVGLSAAVIVPPTLATMIGLGVGIDRALFVVTRHKAQA